MPARFTSVPVQDEPAVQVFSLHDRTLADVLPERVLHLQQDVRRARLRFIFSLFSEDDGMPST